MINFIGTKRNLIIFFLLTYTFLYCNPCHGQEKPNIIILLMDDVGYGDLQNYGSPTTKTPNMNRFGNEGIRFTSFEAAPWCVPSRAELMTGRYMARTKFNGNTGAGGHGGLPDTILTLAEGLRRAGYATGMAGKWHLGYDPKKYLPTNRGFDSWLGLPYSNDYKRPYVPTDVPLVMYRDTTVVEYPVDQDSLTLKYTAEAIRFIKKSAKDKEPFFFYLAYNMGHLPLHVAPEFLGKSGAGLRGDVMMALDWSVGQIMETLKKEGLSKNTIVFLGSDNGPWREAPPRMFLKPTEPEGSNWKKHWEMYGVGNSPWDAGSAGPLRGFKHTTYEGGPRVPAMILWPGHIKPGQVSDEMVTNMDIFTTFLKLGGGKLPHYKIDGMDMLPFFTGAQQHSSRNEFGYFINSCQGIRLGEWKLRITTGVGGDIELFNMQYDPQELYNQAKDHPEIVKRLEKEMKRLAKDVGTDLPVAAGAEW
ncbi:arylsulfatase [Hanamia caeni]|jgi:arylsulfatase A-like enzyme|uniref:Arylsulfatase n=1 Tax=Hanamia caeni TaxID=2294116 RepID=A0A3M9N787_9BACT|nr:sulfatase-like hydrolase/transferase [Hanamia caeni]RNI33596.1 arylsulfatase [Hanamia caeni]